jgi:predicted ABC-type ATPase
MANSKLIIVEGPQGAGKTTVTDFIRHGLKYTNLYRLCGTADSTPTGKQKAKDMYVDLLEYMKKLENKSINLVFDRTFFTEEIYSRLKFKQYDFSDVYYELVEEFNKLDYDIYYITLYLEDTNLYTSRLARDGKAITDYAKFNINSSINQQEEYLKMADEISSKYSNIKVFKVSNDNDEQELKSKIRSILNF